MNKVTQITNKGFYQLEEHASVESKTEFLKHFNLNQNVVFTASSNDQNEMHELKFKSSAILTTIPLEDGINNHFYFTFKKLSINILSQIFQSAIKHIELDDKLPKSYDYPVNWQITFDKTVYNIKIWKVDTCPHLNFNYWVYYILPNFIVEIY